MPTPDELRQLVEDLALRLMVEGPPPGGPGAGGWIESLERIRENAAMGQSPVAESAAQQMLEVLRDGERVSDSTQVGSEIQAGILRLQESLENAPRPQECAETSLAQDRELLTDFIVESREHLARIETQVLALERDPCNSEALNSIFRGFHTIKGLAGFLELAEVQKLAHQVETVLDRARNLELKLTPQAIDVILESADHLRRWIEHIDARLQNRPSQEPTVDSSLVSRIRALTSVQEPPPTVEIAALASAVEGSPVPEAGREAVRESAPVPSGDAAQPERRSEALTVKVDTGKLDYLVDMAGEMVIAESLVRHDPELKTLKSQRLQRNMAQLVRITGELQKTAMALRLVPIGPLFRRMARLVRDLSRQFGKQVEMQTEGDDIELDRTIVEELADPLMHMVRNSLDHGIELPADRRVHGKRCPARLTLRALHQAGQVVIEISDDGRGLDREKILARAAQRGLVSDGAELSDSEVHNLIFEPGFTTAERVTSVSGRGVGMDVVRRHIEKLRGRIEIHSSRGEGTSFLLKLPLTLAIIDGLVVGVGNERFIVPLFAVREMFRPARETVWTVQNRGEMALVRDALLPVFRLYRKFRMAPRSEDPCQSVFIVAEVEGARFCLVVDELIGKQEVVIKSLGETFKNVVGIAGGAILGDGRVGLILDLERLFKDRNSEAGH